jgi:hypothetical protein
VKEPNDVSKQLSLSAVLSVLATAAFMLSATPNAMRDRDADAPAGLAAPALEAELPRF